MQLKEDVSDQNTLIIKSLTNDNDVTIKLFQVKALLSSSSSFFIARFSVRVAGAVAQD